MLSFSMEREGGERGRSGERRAEGGSAGMPMVDGFSLVGGVWEMVGGHGREREVGDTQDFFVNPIKAKIFL